MNTNKGSPEVAFFVSIHEFFNTIPIIEFREKNLWKILRRA